MKQALLDMKNNTYCKVNESCDEIIDENTE